MDTPIISTIGQKCRRCYSCIRECPAIAIRVMNGQAVVMHDRCISCGHCVKVCSQQAKQIKSDIRTVLEGLLPSGKAAVIIAPSFAASFGDDAMRLPAALRHLGFSFVGETAFGADLISRLYADELENYQGKTIISSACPAVYNFIEKYQIELVDNIARIVSPMIAMGRYLKQNLGNDYKITFIGPCVAKKSEYLDEEVSDAIDAVLTFNELKSIFRERKINLREFPKSEFDPPNALMGKSFPLAGGLLKTADIKNDLLEKDILVVEGKDKVIEVIGEIANNNINAKLVDILFCEGCISGPAIDSDLNYYSKREAVIKYIDAKINQTDKQLWKSNLFNSRDLNLKRGFRNKNQRKPMPSEEKIREILARSNKYSRQDELNCTACGYPTCREYAISIAKGIAEEEMCLPYLIDKLEKAYEELKNTQEQLHSAEKLASIGQLAAGVAHEINNPLGTILLYASMLRNTVTRMQEKEQFSEDLTLIIEETNRCKNIVANLLNFARQGKLRLSRMDIYSTVSRIIKTFAVNPLYSAINFNLDYDKACPKEIEVDADQMKEVFLNIINNACEAVEEAREKEISIRIFNREENIFVEIKDNGCGIPKENLNKLFTPFFTTKKMGKGTGLGLAIAYGIIKMHRGDITVSSKINEGTLFTIKLPAHLNNQTFMN